MKFSERLLNLSNSYVYYKKEYIKLINHKKKLIEEKKRLTSNLNNLKKENDYLKSELLKNNEKIIELKNKLNQLKKCNILNKLADEKYKDLVITIKSPNLKGEHHWGDYFFALALKKSFEKYKFNVFIQEYEEWYDTNIKSDINIVLRGLSEYKPSSDEINVMWNISHPELVNYDEYEAYDLCFVASEKYANELNAKLNTLVFPLLQCTDPEVFYSEKDLNYAEDILFVGITRGVYREVVKDIMQTEHNVSIYGMGWDEFIDKRFIKGEFIPNSELHKYYSSCKILLNDHWEDMRDMDFPSNRLFDALACGTFVISDKIPSASTLFEDTIVTYDDVDDLKKKLDYYLINDFERNQKAQKGREIVLKNHTFDNRVDTIISTLKNLVL